ncbi:hypothetical protein MMC17_005821 [Xylographa soralifera]|nr:hypothetical protein [Xylographa soralifera]
MDEQYPSQSFYTHETMLYTGENPHVIIRSLKLPLVLRSPTPDDAAALLQIFTDPRNIQHDESAGGLDTPEAIHKKIIRWVAFTNPLTHMSLVVEAEGKDIGVGGFGWIGVMKDGSDGRVGDAGIMLNPEARGKGYAYEALRMTIDHALRVLQLDEVTISMTKANAAMRGLMDKKFCLPPKEFNGDNGMELQYTIKKDDWLSQLHS